MRGLFLLAATAAAVRLAPCPHLTCELVAEGDSSKLTITHHIQTAGPRDAHPRHMHRCVRNDDTNTCACTCEAGMATNDAGETGEDNHHQADVLTVDAPKDCGTVIPDKAIHWAEYEQGSPAETWGPYVGQIQPATQDACQAACETNDECMGWTYNYGGTGWSSYQKCFLLDSQHTRYAPVDTHMHGSSAVGVFHSAVCSRTKPYVVGDGLITGDVSGLTGHLSARLQGDVSGLTGDITGLEGTLTKECTGTVCQWTLKDCNDLIPDKALHWAEYEHGSDGSAPETWGPYVGQTQPTTQDACTTACETNAQCMGWTYNYGGTGWSSYQKCFLLDSRHTQYAPVDTHMHGSSAVGVFHSAVCAARTLDAQLGSIAL